MPYPPMIGVSFPWNDHFLSIRESFLLRKFPTIWYVLYQLLCGKVVLMKNEDENVADPFAIAIKKSGVIVRNTLRKISSAVSLL